MQRPQDAELELGSAQITPSALVVAGSFGTWELRYRAGARGLAVGGGLVLDTDSDSDWGELQFDAPAEPNFTSISCSGRSRLSWSLCGGFLKQKLLVVVCGQPLAEGQEICIRIGDTGQGGPGARAQTFAEARRTFRLAVDVDGDGHPIELVPSPCLTVVGGAVERLSLIAPSKVRVGVPFDALLRALDRYSNPSFDYDLGAALEGEVFAPGQNLAAGTARRGVFRLEGLRALGPGLHRLRLRDGEGRVVESNPILCVEGEVGRNLYWGDLHGQVRSTDKLDAYFGFARDVSGLDFASHQRNDHEVSTQEWEETQVAVQAAHAPGRFVSLLGYEWSGRHEVGGDHNVYFAADRHPIWRSGHDRVADTSDLETDLPHVRDLHRALSPEQALLIPHVGGRPANLDFHDPALEPVIEVHSTHGSFEWFLREALERGLRVGFVAGSDDYKLRLGGAVPGVDDRRFARGGLTAVFAQGLSRDALFEALRARRCYGTTGERILLEVECDGHPMGEAYSSGGAPRVRVQVAGTAALESVEVYRGLDRIYRHPALESAPLSNTLKLWWQGSSRRWPYSGVRWDGVLRVRAGAVHDLRSFNLDRGDEFVSEVSDREIRWRSFTSGGPDGLRFEAAPGTELEISCTSLPTECVLGRVSGPLSQPDRAVMQIAVDEMGAEPTVVELGAFERRISVQRLARSASPREVELSFVDNDFGPAGGAYWVKVVQEDGAMAWSSPIFVDAEP